MSTSARSSRYVVTLAGVTIAGRSSALPASVSRNASTA
jgi:hypothetical protein